MTSQELYRKLCEYNEDETFYIQYYDAKQNKWNLEEFLKNLDFEKVIDQRLIIPEVSSGWMPVDMSDDIYFDSNDKNSIVMSKHNRYTPMFRHKHIFFEMVYVMWGSCRQRINQEEIELKEGQFLLIAPEIMHSVGVFDSSVIINILIRRSTFEDIFYDMLRDTNKISIFFNSSLFENEQNAYLIFDTDHDALFREFVLDMFLEFLNKKKYYEKILNGQLMILFTKLLQLYEDKIQYPPRVGKSTQLSMQILGYIEKYYQTVSLSEVAGCFHLSEAYCSRLIKKHTGKSFTMIVQNIKFRRACSLLETSHISIAEISRLSGFEYVEHFNRLFKRRYQMTPGQYRKRAN